MVNVASDNTAVATLSVSTVTVPSGSSSTTFTVTSIPVAATATASISATLIGGGSGERTSDCESSNAIRSDSEPDKRDASGFVNRNCYDFRCGAHRRICGQSLEQQHVGRNGPGHNDHSSRVNLRHLYGDNFGCGAGNGRITISASKTGSTTRNGESFGGGTRADKAKRWFSCSRVLPGSGAEKQLGREAKPAG